MSEDRKNHYTVYIYAILRYQTLESLLSHKYRKFYLCLVRELKQKLLSSFSILKHTENTIIVAMSASIVIWQHS